MEKYTENLLQNAYNILQHYMCDFLIILHIVSLSVGLTFTPGIGCTTICCVFAQKVIALITDDFGFLVL